MQKDKDYADLKAKIAELERMAEKKNLEIEASNVSIKIWKNTAGEFKKCNDDLKAQLEAAQDDLERMKSEYDKVVDHEWVLDSELERVKAVAEKMASRLKLIGIGEDVLTEYQNLKQ